jgi:hypothetical protein
VREGVKTRDDDGRGKVEREWRVMISGDGLVNELVACEG